MRRFDRNGTQIMVLDYFEQTYQIRLKFANLPALEVGF